MLSYSTISENDILTYNNITDKDIIVELENTYPNNLVTFVKQNKILENEFNDFLVSNHYNIIFKHATRLTNFEYRDIYENGIKIGQKDYFIKKIQNLPQSISIELKKELIQYIRNLKYTQSNNFIYAFCGKANFKTYDDGIFLTHWGGETIYSYFDITVSNINAKHKNEINKKLNAISKPYVIVFRISYIDLLNCNWHSLYHKIKEEDCKNINGVIFANSKIFQIVDIVPFDKNWKIEN